MSGIRATCPSKIGAFYAYKIGEVIRNHNDVLFR